MACLLQPHIPAEEAASASSRRHTKFTPPVMYGLRALQENFMRLLSSIRWLCDERMLVLMCFEVRLGVQMRRAGAPQGTGVVHFPCGRRPPRWELCYAAAGP